MQSSGSHSSMWMKTKENFGNPAPVPPNTGNQQYNFVKYPRPKTARSGQQRVKAIPRPKTAKGQQRSSLFRPETARGRVNGQRRAQFSEKVVARPQTANKNRKTVNKRNVRAVITRRPRTARGKQSMHRGHDRFSREHCMFDGVPSRYPSPSEGGCGKISNPKMQEAYTRYCNGMYQANQAQQWYRGASYKIPDTFSERIGSEDDPAVSNQPEKKCRPTSAQGFFIGDKPYLFRKASPSPYIPQQMMSPRGDASTERPLRVRDQIKFQPPSVSDSKLAFCNAMLDHIPKHLHIKKKLKVRPTEESMRRYYTTTDGMTWTQTVFPALMPIHRDDIMVLDAWLGETVEAYIKRGQTSQPNDPTDQSNTLEDRKSVSRRDFLIGLFRIYRHAMKEAARQVSYHCRQQSEFTSRVWDSAEEVVDALLLLFDQRDKEVQAWAEQQIEETVEESKIIAEKISERVDQSERALNVVTSANEEQIMLLRQQLRETQAALCASVEGERDMQADLSIERNRTAGKENQLRLLQQQQKESASRAALYDKQLKEMKTANSKLQNGYRSAMRLVLEMLHNSDKANKSDRKTNVTEKLRKTIGQVPEMQQSEINNLISEAKEILLMS